MPRIIIVAFLMLSVCFIYSSDAVETVIHGKLTGRNSSPMELAHVHLFVNSDEPTESFKVSEKGEYEIKFNHDGSYKLLFTGVGHKSFEKEFIQLSNEDFDLDTKLEANIILDSLSKLTIIGNFNDFDFSTGTPMKESEGKYFADIDSESDTIFYQLLGPFGNRSINGTMSDGFVYDNGGDYRSFIINDKGKVRIEFNPELMPKEKGESFIVSKSDFINSYLKWSKIADSLYLQMRIDYGELLQERDYDNMDSVRIEYIIRMGKYCDEIKDESAKLYYLMKYIELITYGQTLKFRDYVNIDCIKTLTEILTPDSKLWANFYYEAYHLSGIIYGPGESDYLKELIEHNPVDKAVEAVISKLMMYYFQEENEEKGREYYNMLLDKFPEGIYARNARREYSLDKKIIAGKELPFFRIENMDKPSEYITPETLKGKYVLIDIWGTWCYPCIMEMEHLHSAYEKFKDKNFEILSIAVDASPDNVKNFRSKKWKMPWLHAFGGDWKADIFETFEVVGVPKPILISPDGKIITLEGLRQEGLEKTLEEYLGE
jgi:thiol-disulfide isomerase/thioredoxin